MKKNLPEFAKVALGEDLGGKESEVHIDMSNAILEIYMADDDDDYDSAISTESVGELIEYCKNKGTCEILIRACYEFNLHNFQTYYDKIIEAFPQITTDDMYKNSLLGLNIERKMRDGMRGVPTHIFHYASAKLLLMYLHSENNFGADKQEALHFHLLSKPKDEWPKNIRALILTHVYDKEILFACAKLYFK